MRRGLLVGGVVGALNAGLGLVLVWWFGRRPTEFGWWSYSPMPRRYSDVHLGSDFGPITPRWEVIAVTVAAFVVANMFVAALMFHRRRQSG
jgi:hypothetical protein